MKLLQRVAEHYEAALKAIATKKCEDAGRQLNLANRVLGQAAERVKLEPLGVQADFKRTVDSVNRLGHRFSAFCTCKR